MPLRKSPARTPALLAALRANARKSHGPKTARGKARSSLNALKHGRYALRLRRKLVEAGDGQGEALYARIEARVAEAFCSSGWVPAPPPSRRTGSAGTTVAGAAGSARAEGMPARSVEPMEEERHLRRLTSLVWCFAARRRLPRLPAPKTIRECAMESIGYLVRDLSEARFRVHDGRRRIGLVFWIQRRRVRAPGSDSSAEPGFEEFWERFGDGFRRMVVALDHALFAFLEGRGEGGPKPEVLEQLLDRFDPLSADREWESGLRSRIFRLRRPNIWAGLHYGLDKDGVYSPRIEARGRRELKKLCLAGIPVSSWPSVMDGSLVPDPTLIPYGFEEMA